MCFGVTYLSVWLVRECILCLVRRSGYKYVGIFFSVIFIFKGTNLAVWCLKECILCRTRTAI